MLLRERAGGRWWPGRAVVVVLCAWFLMRMSIDTGYRGIFGGINLGIHEGGHLVFAAFGEWMMVAGGTIAQLAVPLIVGAILLRQRDDIGVCFALVWLASNLLGIATYMADARALELQLVTVGGAGGPVPAEDMHDWHRLLGWAGLLAWDTTLAALLRLSGLVLGWLAVAAGIWWCVLVATHQPQPQRSTSV